MIRIAITAVIAALVALTAASPALGAHHRWSGLLSRQRWLVLDERCRGGARDNQTTMQACAERDLFADALFAHGYCYVGVGAASRWERGPASRWAKRGEQAVCHC